MAFNLSPDNLPDGFARTIVEVYGDIGTEWLQRLPTLLDECARRWSLTLLPPFAPLSYNYVAPATREDGTPVVLKVGVPCRELLTEIAALRCYDGRGIARLIDADGQNGALLLERLQPGTMLSTLVLNGEDAKATTIAANVMRQLWRPAPAEHAFSTVHEWAQGLEKLRARFQGGTGLIPVRLVEEAETLFTELLASASAPVLLHGDLHHFNILRATPENSESPNAWLAIDPKGVIGEPAYEIGALLRNPWPQLLTFPDPARLLARRIHQLADELHLDRARIRGWGLAQSVLSAWWSVEDNSDPSYSLAVAELIAQIPA